MKFYDCSLPLSPSLVTWPGEEPLSRQFVATIPENGVEVSTLSMGSHTGTHIDAPRHFVAGSSGIDAIPLEALIGEALVVDLTHMEGRHILPEHLNSVPLATTQRLLFKTPNSTRQLLDQPQFIEDYVSLAQETAELLVNHHVKLVGVDYLSVEKKGNPGHPVHTKLLAASIVIVEGVRLHGVPAGQYQLVALPLRIIDGDGSPARVLLMK